MARRVVNASCLCVCLLRRLPLADFGQRKVAVTYPCTFDCRFRMAEPGRTVLGVRGGGSHVWGVFWGCLRVIYRSTYVGFSDRSLNSETSIFLMSTSETIETKITTSVRYLIFHQEDSVRNPQTLVLVLLES